MKSIKKVMSVALAVGMMGSLTACGGIKDALSKIPVNTNMSLTLNVKTGDNIKVSMDTTGGYKMQFDNKESVFKLTKNADDTETVVMQGILMTESSFDTYYKTIYNGTNGDIYKSSMENGVSTTVFTYEDNAGRTNCEFLGWIVGTNTGVAFESTELAIKDAEEVFNKLSFEIENTTQADKEYVFEPDVEPIALETPSNVPTTDVPSDLPSDTPSILNPSDVPSEIPSETVNDEPSDEEPSEETPSEEDTNDDKADWKKLDIKIDGVTYSYPYSYKDLKKAGWDFDLKEYGYDNGYILNANEYTFSTVDLHNDKYGKEYDSANVNIGFQNFTDKPQDILDCDIWAIGATAVYGSKPVEKAPKIELAGGITFGSSMEDIIKAYGEPDSTYEGTYYTELEYQNEYTQYMKLYVYKEGGLLEIDLKNYN